MNKKGFLAVIFLTLVFFNISRVVGWRYFSNTSAWTTIVTDDFHHWQLGILLVIVALLLKKYVRWYYKLLAVSIGIIIDESMYVFSPFYWQFNHYSWEGIAFEFLVFAILALLLYRVRIKRS
jgi:hypothetical protein